jgi:hypothetical protein
MSELTHNSLSDSDPMIDDNSFTGIAGRLNENLAAAVLRLVDATQDFTTLIQSFVSAGEALERSLSIHRELGSASQKALEDAREASRAATASAAEAHQSHSAASSLLDNAVREYGAVSGLVSDLQQRIAALSVLASPMPRPHHEPVATADSEPENIAEIRAV